MIVLDLAHPIFIIRRTSHTHMKDQMNLKRDRLVKTYEDFPTLI